MQSPKMSPQASGHGGGSGLEVKDQAIVLLK